MSESAMFSRLEQTMCLIARHPFYPGKQQVVDECLEELEERVRQGTLTVEQRCHLVGILRAETTVTSMM
jgi:hypothetical protein